MSKTLYEGHGFSRAINLCIVTASAAEVRFSKRLAANYQITASKLVEQFIESSEPSNFGIIVPNHSILVQVHDPPSYMAIWSSTSKADSEQTGHPSTNGPTEQAS